MYSGDSLEVETSVNLFGIGNPGSLRGCQRQSQTGAMSSGGSLEVESIRHFIHGIVFFGYPNQQL